jgi:hypothetical protein
LHSTKKAIFVVYLQYSIITRFWNGTIRGLFVIPWTVNIRGLFAIMRFSTQIWKTHIIVSKISSFYFKNIKKTFFRVFDTFLGCSSFFISAITVGYFCTPLVFLQNIEKTFFQYKMFWYILKKLLSFAQYKKAIFVVYLQYFKITRFWNGTIRGLFVIPRTVNIRGLFTIMEIFHTNLKNTYNSVKNFVILFQKHQKNVFSSFWHFFRLQLFFYILNNCGLFLYP